MPKYPAKTYEDIFRDKVDLEPLRSKLKLKTFEVQRKFKEKYPHADAFFRESGFNLRRLQEDSAKILGTGVIAGALAMSSPNVQTNLANLTDVVDKMKVQTASANSAFNSKQFIIEVFKSALPQKPRPLTDNEEKLLQEVFTKVIGVPAKATLEGEHLNTTYGYIGAEQHLMRFPGDTLDQQGSGSILAEGIAPGTGAWGYFAKSKNNLSGDLVNKEKWYAVVQTLYLPDWNSRQPFLRDWYKYRKVLIVNTDNGNAVVADIADSGPAAWTGKQFGGSPEVMDYLGGPIYRKGKVVLFFVDDPENKIPLGPVIY